MSNLSARLYLVSPPIADAEAFAPLLEQALSAGNVGCVLLRLGSRDSGAIVTGLRSLVAAVQIHGVAALVDEHMRLVADVDADGVHVMGSGEELSDALRDLKPSRIVGAGQLALRDDAMTAGEQEVDYVMFGEPAPDGLVAPFDERLERVAWWAEIFQVPCVAYAHGPDEIEVFASHGAEFVALGDLIWDDARGPAAAVRDAEAALDRGAATFAAEQSVRA